MRNHVPKNIKRRGNYYISWQGTTDAGHWQIYDMGFNKIGSADDRELDERLRELDEIAEEASEG